MAETVPGGTEGAARPAADAQWANVLDLVRQYGVMHAACVGLTASGAEGPAREHHAEAEALFARIATLLPQQPVQARDISGLPMWQHDCGWSIGREREPHPLSHQGCHPGPWRPLLVGGTPAPERTCPGCGQSIHRGLSCVDAVNADPDVLAQVTATPAPEEQVFPAPPHPYERGPYQIDGSQACGICGSRRAAAVHRRQPDLIAQVMEALGVDRPEDVLAAIELMFTSANRGFKERDVARAEVERLKTQRDAWIEQARQVGVKLEQFKATTPQHVDQVDTVRADGTHTYWSTHCRHGKHKACSATEMSGRNVQDREGWSATIARKPAQCKTCAAPCICPCHKD